MNKTLTTTLILLLFTFSAYAQVTSPTPAPTPTPAAESDVIKISTNLIQVDVTVTDKKGNVVRDLKPEDFQVFENGVRQDITNFSFVSNVRTQTEKTVNEKRAVPVPRAEIRPEQTRRAIALVVDDLTLSFQSVHFVRRALRKFVDEQMQDGDLVAIIRTGANVGALQQFTSDKRLLYSAIENVRWNSFGKGGLSPFKPIQNNVIDEETESADEESNIDGETMNFEKFREDFLVSGSLNALRYIVNGMNELPGRKSVIFLSDGFTLFTKDAAGMIESDSVLQSVRRVIDSAYRASVVIYAVDARGLQTAGITAEDQVTSQQQANAALSSRREELFETQQGLSFLAEETGGFAITNNNDINYGVRKILDDQSYYLIAYQPDEDTFDAQKRRFNKLEIKVKNKDLTVRYRSGFFNVSDEKITKPASNQTPAQQLAGALVSPFAANEISLRLNALFGNNPGGSFVRSLLHINTKDLKFEKQADGNYKTSFDILAMSFGDNGSPVDQIGRNFEMMVPGGEFEKILRDGVVYYFTFPVRQTGAYQFRVALRDRQTGKIGSASQFIEVPNLKKSRLTISGIILENLSVTQWQKFSGDTTVFTGTKDNQADLRTNPMNDTSRRRFKRGTVLRYGFEVYNNTADAAKNASLTTQIRIYRDGEIILEGKQNPLEMSGQTDPQRIKSAGAINLTNKMQAGDYILQIIVADNQAKGKRKIATQFVQFEITE